MPIFPRLDAFFPQKRLQKSPCVSSPEAQIKDRCLPAFTDGNARLLICGVLGGWKYGAFSQQLSVVAHASADAYASHVAEMKGSNTRESYIANLVTVRFTNVPEWFMRRDFMFFVVMQSGSTKNVPNFKLTSFGYAITQICVSMLNKNVVNVRLIQTQ
jgi:hypothetical protein